MLILKFYHTEEELHIENTILKATCKVRNEINGKRMIDEVVHTCPVNDSFGSLPYYPRRFPTGLWRVKKPIWTDDTNYWPVKIPTDAIRRVLIWNKNSGTYSKLSGKHQDDAYYHLHFAKNSRTTLGCIRLNSEEDARSVAELVEFYQKKGEEVWLEVLVNRK